MKKRYIQTLMLLLAALLVSHNAKAQEPGTSTVSTGPTVRGSVFGGGNLAKVEGSVTVNVSAGTVANDVYGGGAKASTNTGNTANTTENTTENTTKVFLLGGTIEHNVYGGGLGEKSGVGGATADNPAYVKGNVKVYLNGLETDDYVAASHSSLVTGLDTDGDGNINYYQVGNDGCKVKGNIFGCNNLCGTPLGKVKVHVFKTFGYDEAHTKSTGKTNTTYDVAAVYGGGDMAAYEPTDATSTVEETKAKAYAEVVIDGCDFTSIQQVYGGGNAASTPATNVVIYETYEIGEVFGGGNGKDPISYGSTTRENPGANVGYRNYSTYDENTGKWLDNGDADTKEERLVSSYLYGSGAASVNIYGGTVHQVFGGSNTKGNVRISAVTLLDDNNDCDFKIDEAYGGGKSAPMDAEAKLLMSCIPGLKAAYGGAEAANIEGDVTLTITNGTFDRVFGGNNISGRIGGTITVNIEETGCKPVIIGQLYGGGNQAAYTGPLKADSQTDRQGPTVNVRSFTSIGDVYGGGYGKTAVVTGNTTVNINVCKGYFSTPDGSMADYINDAIGDGSRTITFTEYKRTEDGGFETDDAGNRLSEEKAVVVTLPTHENDKIGAINNVYGGGNAAKVEGDTYVNVGTQTGETVTLVSKDGENVEILGADIRGNVYGGGNQAEVTGDTHVVIGKKATPTP